MKLKTLKVFCKKVKIKGYSKLNKQQLQTEYSKYLACLVIQRCYRKWLYRNAVDCITMDPVKYPCFIYCTKFGKLFFYNYDSLIKYIMKTGDTRDPNTRNNYTDTDLIRLDQGAKQHFPEIRYSNTLKIKKNINYAKRIRNRENEILSYQLRLDEIKEIILIVIEMESLELENVLIDNVHYRSIQVYIDTILNELTLLYNNLKVLDPWLANCFKTSFLEKINNNNIIKNIHLL